MGEHVGHKPDETVISVSELISEGSGITLGELKPGMVIDGFSNDREFTRLCNLFVDKLADEYANKIPGSITWTRRPRKDAPIMELLTGQARGLGHNGKVIDLRVLLLALPELGTLLSLSGESMSFLAEADMDSTKGGIVGVVRRRFGISYRGSSQSSGLKPSIYQNFTLNSKPIVTRSDVEGVDRLIEESRQTWTTLQREGVRKFDRRATFVRFHRT